MKDVDQTVNERRQDKLRADVHPGLRALAVASVLAGLSAAPVFANAFDGFMGIEDPAMLRAQGWQQIQNGPELLEFAVAVVAEALMTAAIAFHPVVLSERRSKYDCDEPRSLFL